MKGYRQILEEIESLQTTQVMFIDDNFIGNPDRARHFLRYHIPEGLTWHTSVSADIGKHEDILDLMALTGCKSLFIGFETLNPGNLEGCGKHQNRISEYESTIGKIHSRGMMVNASLIFGFDHDGPDIFPATLEWLVENRVETMTGHILTPYPGTKFHKQLLEEHRIFDFDLLHYNTSHVVFHPARMSADELREGYLWIYREFYSWRRILARLPESRSQWTAYLLFNFLYRKYGKAISLAGKLGLMRAIAKLAKGVAYPDVYKRLFSRKHVNSGSESHAQVQ
jgi:radical SAM superfamily enzyme YgiQ (UPF0313 family)